MAQQVSMGAMMMCSSKLVFAAVAGLEDGRFRNVRLAFGCVGPTVLRARGTERRAEDQVRSQRLGEDAAELLPGDLSPIDDHQPLIACASHKT